MPVLFLTDTDRQRFSSFPKDISPNDIITFFTLSDADKARIPKTASSSNRLGYGLQIGAHRMLGFCPDDLSAIPSEIVTYVARQLRISADVPIYGDRRRTRMDHLKDIEAYLGFCKAEPTDLEALLSWLVERTLEHDKPAFLVQLVCEKLQQDKFIRPGISVIERLVATARSKAEQETYKRLAPLLTDELKELLDNLLVPDKQTNRTPLAWLSQPAVSNSSSAILAQLEKLKYLKTLPTATLDLYGVSPNRLKLLTQLGKRSTNQALQRAPVERRYPILLAFSHQSLRDITDEIMDMFDACLDDVYRGARHDLDDFKKKIGKSANEKVMLLEELGEIVLDEKISDEKLREVIYRYVPPEKLQSVIQECRNIVRPLQDHYYDFLATRYSYLRQFVPTFLESFSFQANIDLKGLLDAISLLRQMNITGARKLPDEAPLDFLPDDWKSYVIDRSGRVDRRYWELCVLWELRRGLRSGNIYLFQSKRYANPEQYIIPPAQWSGIRGKILLQMKVTAPKGEDWLKEREAELSNLCVKVEQELTKGDAIRIEEGKVVVTPLSAEAIPESARRLREQITKRLPRIELSDLIIEVDSWTNASVHLKHINGNEPKTKELLTHLYAIILAQSCNLGLQQMADNAGFSYDRLAWANNWYLREETLKEAFSTLVNFQHHQPLSSFWGGGTLSSSDGQRFPVSVKTKNATALPRYFSYGKGLQYYTWLSDQYSQFGVKVIPATVRDALYVLDEILGNETELPILEHTTDTAGYTELVFALFHLLGLQFSPRLRDLPDQTLYRISKDGLSSRLIKDTISQKLIINHYDDLLRIAGSLKTGWVTASLLIGKLQAYPQQNILTQALQECGRVMKTIFILKYLTDPEKRRYITIQLNKGEAIHSLRSDLFFANQGHIRKHQYEDQNIQLYCLNLMTNAIITWNTVYMQAVIEQLKIEGYPVLEEDIVHLSPARYEHINFYGKYLFRVTEELERKGLRPLRNP